MKENDFILLLKNRLRAVNCNRVPKSKEIESAAVLVPIISDPNRLSIILTQRTKHLKDHPGQISFPGGRYESKDPNLAVTSLRETSEEIGIPADKITLLGKLPQIRTISGDGFLVTPYVGLLKPPLEFKINSLEVDDIFEVPMEYLLDLSHYKKESITHQGALHSYYVIHYENRIIWGATASILHDLALLISR